MGILSLIFWTLTILVTFEYTYLAMHIGKKGEGGTIVLKETLLPLLKVRQPDRICLVPCDYRHLAFHW